MANTKNKTCYSLSIKINVCFSHTSLVSTMQTIEISSRTSTSIILLTSPTFWVRDSSNTFIYNCAVWNVYPAKMRQLESYNALNTLREIGRPLCFNKKSTTHAYFLVYVSFYRFLIRKFLHILHFSLLHM